MSVYYNDNDQYAVAWLRALIGAGVLPQGEVDDRSIEAVAAADVRGFTQCHFFAGIGGWPYALRLAGWSPDRPVWTGSCPCGPFSSAGRGAVTDDTRHLWPAWFRLIEQCRPDVVFGEQVASPDGLAWLDVVCAALEGAAYAVGACDLCAASVGAPINRPRLFIVAQPERARLERHPRHESEGGEQSQPDRPVAAAGAAGPESACVDAVHVLRRIPLHDSRRTRPRLQLPADRTVEDGPLWSRFEQVACADGWRIAEPGIFPVAHGVSARVGRLRGYGNAIVPQLAAQFVRAFVERETR